MKISVICSNRDHPVYPWLVNWKQKNEILHNVEIVQSAQEVSGGDILFLISCHEIIGAEIRDRYKSALVVHASDLPLGRGWSPHVWQVLEGKTKIVVSLLEVADKVDSGAIWRKQQFVLEGHELVDEINEKLFLAETELMDFAVKHFDSVVPEEQDESKATYYAKRTPADSLLDVEKSISEQFDLLRVSDPNRYPSYIEYRGYRYNLQLTKVCPVNKKGSSDES